MYDVSNWGRVHPGGEVIYTYGGCDATDVFSSFHGRGAWSALRELKVGVLEDDPPAEELVRDFRDLRLRLKREGLFESNKVFYVYKTSTTFALVAVGAYVLAAYGHTWMGYMSAAVLVALFLQQSGWLAHDYLHHQVFENRKLNYAAGYVIGNLCQGFSSAWWRNKHNTHHAACNWIDDKGGALDPDIDTIPYLAWSADMLGQVQTPLEKFLVRYQQYTIAPLLSIARLSWSLESIKYVLYSPTMEKDGFVLEAVLIALHYICYLGFVSAHLGVLGGLGFFALNQVLASIFLSLVFVQSHNAMDTANNSFDWFRTQVLTTRNVTSDFAHDWFTGGLNMQIEHHLFPTLPRHNLRQTRTYVREICEKHGIPYEECGVVEGSSKILEHLGKVSEALDQRDTAEAAAATAASS